jgi:hypothetical protein
MRPLFTSLLAGTIALYSGCATVYEHENPVSGPWAGPVVQTREIVREELPVYSPTGVKTTFWSDQNGKLVPALEFTDRIVAYWSSLKGVAPWPRYEQSSREETRSGARPQRVIVSINPIVVILVPRSTALPSLDFGGRAKHCGNHLVSSRELVFEYGTSFVDHDELFWFSPDLGVPPTHVNVDRAAGSLTIEHPQFLIYARISDGVWRTERKR